MPEEISLFINTAGDVINNDVFISYSSKDKEIAFTFKRYLEAKNVKCWIAPDSIPGGGDYSDAIPKGIDGSHLFILLLSPNSLESKWVPKELSYAMSQNKKVIPYKIADCEVNKSFGFFLTNVQIVEPQDSFDSIYELITKELKQNNPAKPHEPKAEVKDYYTWERRPQFAVFNSIIDNPFYGDERNFVRIRDLSGSSSDSGKRIIIKRGHIYEVVIYYHNDSDPLTVGKEAIGIADGAAIRSSYPKTVIEPGKEYSISASIIAADTNPIEVTDKVAIVTEDYCCVLRYIPGSATFHNRGKLNGENAGPKKLFGVGSLLGYNKISGLLPGGIEYSGFVTYQLIADYPDFQIDTTAIKNDETHQNHYLIAVKYMNTGTITQNNVGIRVTLPQNVQYLKGTCYLSNNNSTHKKINDDVISINGANIGHYNGKSGWAIVEFQVCCKSENSEDEIKIIVSTDNGNKNSTLRLMD